MDSKILLISEGSTFMVDAIVKNLTEGGFTVIKCAPEMKDIKAHEDDADILANEVTLYIAKQRDLLRHTYAIQFYNELLSDVRQYQEKIVLLKTNVSSVSRKQVKEISAIQYNAAVSSKFQLYLPQEPQEYLQYLLPEDRRQLRTLPESGYPQLQPALP